MSFDLNPNTVYYLLLYGIILVMRFFKMYRPVKSATDGKTWKYYWFLALEFVYSSAGIVIVLLAAAPRWLGVIIMAYSILLLVSAFLDVPAVVV